MVSMHNMYNQFNSNQFVKNIELENTRDQRI